MPHPHHSYYHYYHGSQPPRRVSKIFVTQAQPASLDPSTAQAGPWAGPCLPTTLTATASKVMYSIHDMCACVRTMQRRVPHAVVRTLQLPPMHSAPPGAVITAATRPACPVF